MIPQFFARGGDQRTVDAIGGVRERSPKQGGSEKETRDGRFFGIYPSRVPHCLRNGAGRGGYAPLAHVAAAQAQRIMDVSESAAHTEADAPEEF